MFQRSKRFTVIRMKNDSLPRRLETHKKQSYIWRSNDPKDLQVVGSVLLDHMHYLDVLAGPAKPYVSTEV